ncbi:thioredoxin, mitochondrial [Acrasis kona]|uniref:Thioredoxin, mitochondrial n=1 Tax=Acrasis kona TaxID=1008807 RepID=A0AAW2YRL8_9EUKA
MMHMRINRIGNLNIGKGIFNTYKRCYSSSKNVVQLKNLNDFEEQVIKSKAPVVVDFYADWCGPCKNLTPKLVGLAEKYDGKFLLAKVDIDDINCTEIVRQYEIRALPTLVMFKNGEPTVTIVGDRGIDPLESDLKQLFD